jgi:hypothetical protein
MPDWHPGQIAAKYVNGQRTRHQYSANPEAPVPMHPLPIRARIGLTTVAAVSLRVVLVSSHLFSMNSANRWAILGLNIGGFCFPALIAIAFELPRRLQEPAGRHRLQSGSLQPLACQLVFPSPPER